MNDHSARIGLSALEHIRYLVTQIGARPAGSAKERLALDYAAEQLIRFGYQPEWTAVAFAPAPWINLQNLFVECVLIASIWLWPYYPYLTILCPFLLLAAPELDRLEVALRRKTMQTMDVAAFNEGPQDAPLLIFCAHADTAPAMALDNSFLVQLNSRAMRIMQRIAILVALLSLVTLLGFGQPVSIYWPVAAAGSLVSGCFLIMDLINSLYRKKGYAPGAVDNASGVGMVLSLAEYFSEQPPKRLRLGFLITGAEETGLQGAAAIAARLGQRTGKTALFNLDMVGAGKNIQVVTQVGSFLAQSTTKPLNTLLFDVDPRAKGVWYSLKSGDFAAFLRAGMDAVSIQMAGSTQAETAYHTIKDDIHLIDLRSLEICGNMVIRFVEMLPYSDWTINSGN